MSLLLAFLAGANGVQAGGVPLICSLRDPLNVPVDFSLAPQAAGTWIAPTGSTTWPVAFGRARLLQSRAEGKGHQFVIDDQKSGLALKLVPLTAETQLATIFRLADSKPEFPVAVGFCKPNSSPLSESSHSSAPATVETAHAFDSERWTDSCALISSNGRAAPIAFLPYDGNRGTFSSAGGWPWPKKVSVDHGLQAVNKAKVSILKLGGRRTLSATSYFYNAGNAGAHLILFDRLGAPTDHDAPAAAICGYKGLTRAISTQ